MSVRDRHESESAGVVSVIVAAYNCASMIDMALTSVSQQTYSNIELVVVDDCSNDGTFDVAARFDTAVPIRVLRQSANGGPSAARNRAIEAASGRWVAQLDGDDWFARERIDTLVRMALRHDADIVLDDQLVVAHDSLQPVSRRFTDKAVPWRVPRLISAEELIRYDLGSLKPLVSMALLESTGIRYPEDIKYGEDFEFLLKLMLAGARVLVVPSPLYRLRRGNTGSLTTQKQGLYRQLAEVVDRLMVLEDVDAAPEIMAALKARRRYIARLALVDQLADAVRKREWRQIVGAMRSPWRLVCAVVHRMQLYTRKRWFRMCDRETWRGAYELPAPKNG
ncbi:glycosyltransferase [Nitrogeniibacter mangrovi]|uniref:Glycosyltransferase n=1 Tax=Nitrogeniibacter mangrovi TaxID=2016596 RepID=A0A6C1AZL1_9RHOO|nr:glycosyltransferase family A protein [Nitrogeniibacter mangrovi]QID16767.1 glycosyltransferase [Nitrogeniibacter mangrovi]